MASCLGIRLRVLLALFTLRWTTYFPTSSSLPRLKNYLIFVARFRPRRFGSRREARDLGLTLLHQDEAEHGAANVAVRLGSPERLRTRCERSTTGKPCLSLPPFSVMIDAAGRVRGVRVGWREVRAYKRFSSSRSSSFGPGSVDVKSEALAIDGQFLTGYGCWITYPTEGNWRRERNWAWQHDQTSHHA